MANNISLSCLK